MTQEEFIAFQSSLIAQIINAPFEEAIKTYLHNLPFLDDINFILPNPQGINFTEKFQTLNLNSIDLLYLFSDDNLYCLNQKSLSNILQGKSENLKIETIISLDTQIQSYLYRLYNERTQTIPNNILEVLNLINGRSWLIDCVAYTMENALFDPKFLDTDLYKANTLALESFVFKNPIKAKYRTRRIIDSSKEIFASTYSDHYRMQYKLIYLALLVMTNISFNYKTLSLKGKELTITKYFHEKIGILSDREINLAKLFFTYGTKLRFFGKIQTGRNDLIKNLKNMAWDIFHINNTINNIAKQTTDHADFTMPFFVTYDQRLREIIPLYKIKAAAFNKATLATHIFYVTDLLDPEIKQQYFTAEALINRRNRISLISHKELLERLEKEINNYELILVK